MKDISLKFYQKSHVTKNMTSLIVDVNSENARRQKKLTCLTLKCDVAYFGFKRADKYMGMHEVIFKHS